MFFSQAKSSIPRNPTPEPDTKGKQWCLPKEGADEDSLQKNIDYVCGLGVDCSPIQEGGACFFPDTVRAHAAYAMNAYYQSTGKHQHDCDFAQTGATTDTDPSMRIKLHLLYNLSWIN